MRPRQPGNLTASLCYDFDEVMQFKGYTFLDLRSTRHDAGEFRANVLRETKTGRRLAEIALTSPTAEDMARWTVVVRPEGESRVLGSARLLDIDADFGFADGAARDTVTCYGDTYTGMFETVIVTPSAAVAMSSTSVATWPAPAVDTRTGPAETVALGLIADHFGPAAPVTANRFPRLNIPTSLGRGGPVVIGRRFPNLLDDLRVIGQEGGITVRLEQGAPGVVDVIVTEQTLRPEVTLSTERNTLLAWRVRRSTARATGALVLGKGEGEARVTTLLNAPVPTDGWAYPRRVTVNATSEDRLEPMRLEAREELAELNPPLAVALRPAPSARWVPGIDFDLGDVLPVDEEGVTTQAVVEEITTAHRTDGAPDITAEVGRVPMGSVAGVLNQLRRVVRRDTHK